MTANPFAALLDGVPRRVIEDGGDALYHGKRTTYLPETDVLAALAAAVPADLAEAGEVLEGVTPGPWVSEFLMHEDPNGDEYPSDIEVASQAGRHIHGHDLGYNPDVDLEIIANARFIAWCREGVPALLARIAAQEAQIKGLEHDRDEWRQRAIDRCEASEKWFRKYGAETARAEAAETALAAERAKVAKMVEALRLIELIGYREGEEFGWINAHMRGVATSALTGESIEHYWRLFPKHRAAITEAGQ